MSPLTLNPTPTVTRRIPLKSLKIKDLSTAKDLSSEDLAAVRGGTSALAGPSLGGSNVAFVVGPTQHAQNGGGFNFASPNVQVAPQTVTQTNTSVDMVSVIGSMNTLIGQSKVL